ncbi:unnamed protein product [Darwinula stevensoni]|uniref:DUF155 domain-containing protein n=1 Tax=Darwinula stevensoni TaxID=69355 RepID=A0A7R9A9Z0_9CRUS|nr:unnamed protein product [Darwinula stevensoni]CAG0897900.1 unnamed protein product [Darwinula stevensoni]
MKRIPRKKRSLTAAEQGKTSDQSFLVVSYATCEAYDLEALSSDLRSGGLYRPVFEQDAEVLQEMEIVHMRATYQIEEEPREIFFFPEGSVVFWNVSVLERLSVLKTIRAHETGSYPESMVLEEVEILHYLNAPNVNKTRFNNGKIQFCGKTGSALEKYTFSNALALSVKLGIWEAMLSEYADSIEFIHDDMKKRARIRISRSEVLQKMGALFALRHGINLGTDLLDTPDFYWDREDLEVLYRKTCNNLSITQRTRVMNEKLNHCCELMELLGTHLNDLHHVRLELMIIALIMIEVIFELLHFFAR